MRSTLINITRGVHTADEHTPAQLHRAAELHMGMRIRLPFHSTIDAILISDTQCVVRYTRYEARILARETRLENAWKVADIYSLTGDEFEFDTCHSAEDETFTPCVIAEDSKPAQAISAYHARRAFEAECHRPGTPNAPLDNAERTAEGYTTEPMRKHWA